MKREIKVGMKFLMPVVVVSTHGSQTVLIKTPGFSAFGELAMNKGRLDGLTPEGGWPSEPFKHGDVVVPIEGTALPLPRTVWGDEIDGIICVQYLGDFHKRSASDYELVPPK